MSRLLGAPPGYVGFDEGGQLTEAVRRRPYAVLLFDEMEKAHPEVFNLLLQLLDDGRLTDAKGNLVNFRNTIIIFTSNIGSAEIANSQPPSDEQSQPSLLKRSSLIKPQLMPLLRKRFRPEFLNRIDEFVVFNSLDGSALRNVTILQLRLIESRLRNRGATLAVTPRALNWLSSVGFDEAYGARTVKRTLQKELETPIAVAILEGRFAEQPSTSGGSSSQTAPPPPRAASPTTTVILADLHPSEPRLQLLARRLEEVAPRLLVTSALFGSADDADLELLPLDATAEL